MSLEYRQNIRYMVSDSVNLDQQLRQLSELCRHGIDDYELYQKIRSYIFRQIKIKQLAVTKILDDLQQIRKSSSKSADIITQFICHNDKSYSEVAAEFNCSKQLIHQTVKKYSKEYKWLENLIAVKGMEDSKNENNRTIFFSGKKKVDLFKQLDLFNEGQDEKIEGTF